MSVECKICGFDYTTEEIKFDEKYSYCSECWLTIHCDYNMTPPELVKDDMHQTNKNVIFTTLKHCIRLKRQNDVLKRKVRELLGL